MKHTSKAKRMVEEMKIQKINTQNKAFLTVTDTFPNKTKKVRSEAKETPLKVKLQEISK